LLIADTIEHCHEIDADRYIGEAGDAAGKTSCPDRMTCNVGYAVKFRAASLEADLDRLSTGGIPYQVAGAGKGQYFHSTVGGL